MESLEDQPISVYTTDRQYGALKLHVCSKPIDCLAEALRPHRRGGMFRVQVKANFH